MTIWSGRTQLSIVIGFAAAPMRGNRILRSAVPVGRRVPYSVAAPVSAATPPQQKKSGTQLGAALLAIFRSAPLL